MAHIEHFKRTSVARLCNEWERQKREDGTWKFTPTGEIDESRTHLNYTMEAGNVRQKLASRLADPGLKVDQRKHVNVLSDWVITCPEELRSDPAQQKRFFEVTYAFLQERYGKENVLQGHVHMDEKSPHMHAAIVPEKDGRVSAKALFNKAELRAFHTDLDATLAKEPPEGFGRKGLVKNGRTKGGYTTAELKARSQAEQAQEQRAGELAGQEAAINQERQAMEAERAEISRMRSQAEREAQEARRRLEEARRAEMAVEARRRAVEAREAALPGLATRAAQEAVRREIEASREARRRPSEARAVQDTQAAINAAMAAAGAVKAPSYQRGGKTLSPV